MALPTAPLGQLPNMNMPYQVPTYEVTRGRDRVLQALAAGIAQQLGQGIVSNVMSRDYAEPGAKAGFWSKLIQGPKMSEGQFKDQVAREHADLVQARDIEAKQGLADQQIVFETGRDQARSLSDFQKQIQEEYLADKDRLTRERLSANEINARMDLEKARDASEGSRLDKSIAANLRLEDRRSANDAANNLARARLQQAAELEQIGARAAAEGQTPQGRYYDQQAALLEAQNQLLRQRTGQGGQSNDPALQAVAEYLQQKQSLEARKQMPFQQAMDVTVQDMIRRDPSILQPQQAAGQTPYDPAIVEYLRQFVNKQPQLRY